MLFFTIMCISVLTACMSGHHMCPSLVPKEEYFLRQGLTKPRLRRACYIVEDSLELLIILILLPLPLRHWNYKPGPPCLIYVVLEIEPRTLCMLGKESVFPLPYTFFFFCTTGKKVVNTMTVLP